MSNLKQWATFSFKEHTFLKEWGPFIILVLVAKLIAMCFSVFAGYFFFFDLFTQLTDNIILNKVFTLFNLILIEVTTAIALSKAFKFLIHKKYNTFIFTLLIALGLFSVSFVSSTNGLALRQSRKVDQGQEIKTDYKSMRDSINRYYDKEKANTLNLIETIKSNPQGWEGKRRTKLLSAQLLKIDLYYKDLKRQEQAKQSELKILREEQRVKMNVNIDKTRAEADKYYKLVSVIMLMILCINGLLMYFYSKIAREGKEKEIIRGELNRISTEIDKMILTVFKERVDTYLTFNEEAKPKLALKPKGNYCKHCGAEFKREHTNQKYCSDECRLKYWEGKK